MIGKRLHLQLLFFVFCYSPNFPLFPLTFPYFP